MIHHMATLGYDGWCRNTRGVGGTMEVITVTDYGSVCFYMLLLEKHLQWELRVN